MQPIGTIYTPFKSLENMPIQPKGSISTQGTVVLEPEYQEGLADLDGFSHIYLIYQFHQARRTELTVIPFLDTKPHGVFATRSPLRPNHIGLSIVELQEIRENRLVVNNVDILDGTPLLDIKPYVAEFDRLERSRSGWLADTGFEAASKRSDDRFV